MMEFLKKQHLIKSGTIWNTYYYDGKYYKLIQEDFIKEYHYCIHILLENLMNPYYQMNQISKVLQVLKSKSECKGYVCEEKIGPTIHHIMNQSRNKAFTFYEFVVSFQNILDFCKEKNIIMKDIITKENVKYNPDNKTAYVIDVDSFQIPEYGDKLFCNQFVYSSLKKLILNRPKYYESNRFQPDLNVLSFYELFLQTMYQKSLLAIRAQNLKELEQNTEELLQQVSIPKNSNLYGRIMDTVNPEMPNTLNPQDFYELANHSRSLSKKRLFFF